MIIMFFKSCFGLYSSVFFFLWGITDNCYPDFHHTKSGLSHPSALVNELLQKCSNIKQLSG
ncbi:hypothetical protein FOXYSP1_10787 [Fusarium oxysporum f. sp. phaseoli]